MARTYQVRQSLAESPFGRRQAQTSQLLQILGQMRGLKRETPQQMAAEKWRNMINMAKMVNPDVKVKDILATPGAEEAWIEGTGQAKRGFMGFGGLRPSKDVPMTTPSVEAPSVARLTPPREVLPPGMPGRPSPRPALAGLGAKSPLAARMDRPVSDIGKSLSIPGMPAIPSLRLPGMPTGPVTAMGMGPTYAFPTPRTPLSDILGKKSFTEGTPEYKLIVDAEELGLTSKDISALSLRIKLMESAKPDVPDVEKLTLGREAKLEYAMALAKTGAIQYKDPLLGKTIPIKADPKDRASIEAFISYIQGLLGIDLRLYPKYYRNAQRFIKKHIADVTTEQH